MTSPKEPPSPPKREVAHDTSIIAHTKKQKSYLLFVRFPHTPSNTFTYYSPSSSGAKHPEEEGVERYIYN